MALFIHVVVSVVMPCLYAADNLRPYRNLSRNQRCTMLALMPCCIATPAMDAPGWAQVLTTCSLSSGL